MPRGNIRDIGQKKQDFSGIYRAVVEDNNDPAQMGRVRVRIWGLHTELINESEQEGIPVSGLPWAEPCLGLVEGSTSGYGAFSVPLKGSHVFVFFEGNNWVAPRYFATAPGKPAAAPDTSVGFNDPTGVLPRADRLNEPDYHRLARGKTEETLVEFKNSVRDLAVKIAKPTGGVWDEPVSPYKAEYPENIVLATHRGICVEADNTHGEERVHIYHPSNSYIEIDKDGNTVFRNNKDRFEITIGKRNKHIYGDDNETVNGKKTSKVNLDTNEEVGGNEVRLVIINSTESLGGNWAMTVKGNIDIKAGGNINIEAVGNMKLKAARIDLNPPEPPPNIYVPNYDPATPLKEIAVNLSEDLQDEEIGQPLPQQTEEVYAAAGLSTTNENVPTPPPATDPPPTNTPAPLDASCSSISVSAGIDYNMMLSAHFRLKDLSTHCQLTHYPVTDRTVQMAGVGPIHYSPEAVICNLKTHCINVLEPLWAAKGKFSVTSALREKSDKSWHNHGSATDIQFGGLSDAGYYEMAQWIRNNLKYTELILEYGGNRPWIHVAYNDRALSSRTKTRTKCASTYVEGILALKNIPGVGGVA